MQRIRVERSSRLALAKAQVMNSITVRFAFLDRIKFSLMRVTFTVTVALILRLFVFITFFRF